MVFKSHHADEGRVPWPYASPLSHCIRYVNKIFIWSLKLTWPSCTQIGVLSTASFRSGRRILPVSGQIRQNYPNLCLQMGNQSSFLSWGENTAIFLRNCVKIKISLFSVHKFSWVFTTLDVFAKNFPENAKKKRSLFFVEVQVGRETRFSL